VLIKPLSWVLWVLVVIAVTFGAITVANADHSDACGNDGTPGADVIIGDSHDNCLRGGNGSDVVRGRGGDDKLGGNHGTDSVYGGTGDDRLFGGRGPDYLNGGPGYDRCYSEGRGDNDEFVNCEVIIK
jgi:Ca2+-binding RTX toxin-like protein